MIEANFSQDTKSKRSSSDQQVNFNQEIKVDKINLTPEREQQIHREIAETATFFNTFGRKWFIAGGTSLELSNGGLTRDHQDVDIAMYSEDLPPFFVYVTDSGYVIERPLTSDEISKYNTSYGRDPEIIREDTKNQRTWVRVIDGNELASSRSAFVKPVDSRVSLENGFEVITLHRDELTGGTLFGNDPSIIFPTEVYDSSAKYIATNGQEVPLQPKVVVLMHKLYDGRQKDFEDIKNSLSTIDETEKRALQKLLTENGYEFILSNGITTDNLDNLIELASKEPSPTERAISDAKEKFNQGIEGIYSAWQQSTSKEDFYNRIEQAFGREILTIRASQLAQTADLLFSGEEISKEQFTEFARDAFGYEEFLRQKIRESLSVQRWDIHKSS